MSTMTHTITVKVSLLQKGSAVATEIDAAADARSQHPGRYVEAVRWLSAAPFDSSLAGRWVALEVDLA